MIILVLMGAAAFAFYHLQRIVYRKWWKRGLFVSVGFRGRALFEGEEEQLQEVIENRKMLPLPMLEVKFQTDKNLVFSDVLATQVTDMYYRDDIFHIGSREKITRTLTFTGKKRGYYRINRIDIMTSDLFLTNRAKDDKEINEYIYVYPKPLQSEEFRLSLRQLSGEILTKRHLYEDPFEHRGIREYQPFDELRTINWKATAKTRELKVNQRNYTSRRTVRIFLNVEDTGIRKKTYEVETAIKVAAGLSEFFLKQGMQVACYGNGRDILCAEPVQIEAGGGGSQMENINKALARLDLTQPAVDFERKFRDKLLSEDKGIITIFVSANGYDSFLGIIREYMVTGGEFIWFYIESDEFPEETQEFPQELLANIRVLNIHGKSTRAVCP